MSQRADAATDRVSYTAAPPPAPATAFTAVFWARLRADLDTFSTMMRLHSSSGASTAVTITTGSSGTTPIVVSPGNTGGIIGADALAVDTWRMLAVTVGGTGATDGRIYTRAVGGSTNVVTGQVTGGATPDGITLFGRSIGEAGEWFNGGLAYVRVWSAVLSQSEIEAEWASATIVRTAGVWANWPMLTGITDVSGNGRNLTAGSTALTSEDDPPIASTITGTAEAAFGALGATAGGVRRVNGGAAAAYGGLTAAAAGGRTVIGAAGLSGGTLSGAAAGARTVIGSAAGAFGALDAAAGPPPGPEPAAAAEQGSWYGLLNILHEASDMRREEMERPPVACLDCGEPLRSGPRSEQYCPYDGQVWEAGNRRMGRIRVGVGR
ncbi:hypothetical protein GCM10010400_39970 [Streptomyces aculeolatus]|uniref:LamG-like jellyroll fold domain-containing protein n=1 Tax=Streptomyces aculeolatus TaxID=270689 RepID=UPI001CEC2C5F|nr:LamG-like jellyroll fold domain-containing protein [Streptomyces aculeolatus]